MSTPKLSILVADNHTPEREALCRILEAEPDIHPVAAVTDGRQAVEKARELSPDLVMLDPALATDGCLEVILSIKKQCPGTRIVILSPPDPEKDLLAAFRFGAHGYLRKTARVDEILQAVRRACAGEGAIPGGLVNSLVEEFRGKTDDWDRLSGMEKEVLQSAAAGQTEAKIARSLFITERTVRLILGRFLEKLQARNRVEAENYPGKLVLP